MRYLDNLILGLLAFLIALAMTFNGCGGALGPPPGAAQDRVPDQLVLDALRISFHESVDPYADAPGIHAVLVNGAREQGVSTHAYAMSYAPHFFAGTSDRPWFINLELDCERPEGFVGNWTRPRIRRATRRTPAGTLPPYRDICVATVRMLRTLHEPVCEATEWGSRGDYRSGRFAAEHAHDVFVTCGTGPARNLFSYVPREP